MSISLAFDANVQIATYVFGYLKTNDKNCQGSTNSEWLPSVAAGFMHGLSEQLSKTKKQKRTESWICRFKR